MDFFEAQDQARKRTKWLFFWFFLGIVGVVALVNLLAYFVFGGRFGAEDIPLVSIVTASAILAGSGFKSMQLNGGGAVLRLGSLPILSPRSVREHRSETARAQHETIFHRLHHFYL